MWAECSSALSLTTNGCEVFYSKFNKEFNTTHPNIFKVIDILINIQSETQIKAQITGSTAIEMDENESSRTSICTASLSSSSSVNAEISDSAQPTRKKRRRNNDNYSADRQEQISQALAYMISANGLPISFVQSDGFKHFM
ncbi:hypothetical protein QTP88_019844 [Uroleucon formosanum]